MILVDTDLWIDFFAGAEPGASAVDRLLHQRRAVLSVITAFELLCGVRGKKKLAQLDELCRVVPSIDLSVGATRIAASHYARLKQAGKLIGNQDLLLAGTALEYQLPVLTRNLRHFERITGLEVLSPQQMQSDADNDYSLRPRSFL